MFDELITSDSDSNSSRFDEITKKIEENTRLVEELKVERDEKENAHINYYL